MKTSPSAHSMWNLLRLFRCQGVLLLSSSLVIGEPCHYDSKTLMKKVSGEETTYMDSVGHPLELFCTLPNIDTKTKLTSKNLLFQRDEHVVDETQVRRVNDTTISLKLENKTPSTSKYYCYLNIPEETNDIDSNNGTGSKRFADIRGPTDTFERETVCWNLVEVGSDPKTVNISCTVYNWQELNCSWQVSQNYIHTNYTIWYEPVSSKPGDIDIFVCPNEDDVRNNSCKWTTSTEPPYRKDFQKLKVTVTGVNVFNKTSETSVIFDQFSIVRAKGPEKLKVAGKTSTSIKLEWGIGGMRDFPWTYKILYKTIGSDWTTIICDSESISTNGASVSYNVANLSPNTVYDFRVFMKPSSANDSYWSQGYAANVFRTKK